MGCLISIVIPFYNIEEYVSKCLDSILEQTYTQIEVICVDDGSTDSTGEILDQYSQKDGRVKVIHKENGGLVSARKAGKRLAKGDYIVDVDGDDWIDCNRIELLVREIDDSAADIYYMSGLYRDNGNNSTLSELYYKEKHPYNGTEIENKFLVEIADTNKNFGKMLLRNAYLWAARRELGKACQEMVPDDIVIGEDTALVYYYLQNCDSICSFPNPTYHYVQREDSMSHKKIGFTDICGLAAGLKSENQVFRQLADDLVYFNIVNTVCFEKELDFLYPFSHIKKGEKIAIYGCGGFGQRYMKHLLDNHSCRIICWVDQNVRQTDYIPYEVEPIDRLCESEYDYILVAIINEDIAQQVKTNLISMGVAQEKIVTMDKEYMKTPLFNRYIGGNI